MRDLLEKEIIMKITHKKKLFLILSLISAITWLTVTPVSIFAETSGSYVHPSLEEPGKSPSSLGMKMKEGSKGKPPKHPDIKKKEGSKYKTGKGYKSGHHSPHGYSHGSKGYPHKPGHGKPSGSYSKHGAKKHGYGGHGYKGGSHGKHSGHGGHHRSHGKTNPFSHILKFSKKLGLNEDQIEKIKEMKFSFAKTNIQLRADHTIAHMELDRLVHSGNVDESQIRSVGEKIVKIKTEKIRTMIEAKISLLKLLTDDQRKKISTMHSGH